MTWQRSRWVLVANLPAIPRVFDSSFWTEIGYHIRYSPRGAADRLPRRGLLMTWAAGPQFLFHCARQHSRTWVGRGEPGQASSGLWNDADFTIHEIGGQFGQPIKPTLRSAEF